MVQADVFRMEINFTPARMNVSTDPDSGARANFRVFDP